MSTNKIIGERLNLSQIIAKSNIRIPIIQRDYAQGRKSEDEVRNVFLDKIFEYLQGEEQIRDLDFIYGNVKVEGDNNYFIPLDGQQRLTTMMLLYWYLANLNSDKIKEEFKGKFCFVDQDNYFISKFSYQTRQSSKEFFNELFRSEIDFTKLDLKSKFPITDYITNQLWFSNSWMYDSTVKSILVMLEAIHLKFKDFSNFYFKLDIISFLYLDLNQNNLSDDLYIKMNSRGVELSSFENFKAHFENYLDDLNIQEKYKIIIEGKEEEFNTKNYFAHKLDTDWANIIWELTDRNPTNYDLFWSNLIRTFIIQAVASIKPENSTTVKTLLNKLNPFSFYDYRKIEVFKKVEENENDVQKKNEIEIHVVNTILIFLDTIQKNKTFFFENFWYNDRNILKEILNTDYKNNLYDSRLKFYSFFKFVLKYKDEEKLDLEKLKNWLRLTVNLIDNTAPFNSEIVFITALSSIDTLIDYSDTIYESVSNNEFKIRGFDPVQINEEQLKASLILRNDGWEDIILKAEQSHYFKGQITFLLFLSGVQKKYNDENFKCNWDSKVNMELQNKFDLYYKKSVKIFNNNGLIKELTNNNEKKEGVLSDYIWERALLSIGDYLIKEGPNWSFLIDNDRDISWKRFLKMDKPEAITNNHPLIIQTIFDKIDLLNVNKSLENVIASRSFQSEWQEKFIKNKSLLNYLGNLKYVRKDAAQGFVLFKGKMIHGAHAELFSYDFYTENLKDKSFFPFTDVWYHKPGSDDFFERPCAVLDKFDTGKYSFALEVYYNNKKKKFGIKFFDRNQEFELQKEFLDFLNDFQFNHCEKDSKKHVKLYDEVNLVFPDIISFCKKLENFQNATN